MRHACFELRIGSQLVIIGGVSEISIKAEKLTIAEAGDDGSLREIASGPVGKGARVVVVAGDGTAYAADSQGGALWVVKP